VPFVLLREPEDRVGDCVPLTGEETGKDVGGDVGSDVNRRSGESWTAQSTRMFVVLCDEGDTSAGFHCSSSTNLAD